MTAFAVEVATDARFALAEGPIWDPDAKTLHWVDMVDGAVFSGSIVGSRIEQTERHARPNSMVSAVFPLESGAMITTQGDSVVILGDDADGGRRMRLVPPGLAGRLNDAAVDPQGRLVAGTAPRGPVTGAEVILRLESDGSVLEIDHGLGLSNGIAWSPDGALMYSVDTAARAIYVRSYDTEIPGPRREFVHITLGQPDGLCIDEEGNLWVAIWGAGEVHCYDPDGSRIHTLSVPAPHTSSVAFAGDGLSQLVITTATAGLSAHRATLHPLSGSIFLADVGARGVASPRVAEEALHMLPPGDDGMRARIRSAGRE